MTHKAVILGCNYYIGLSTIRCLGIHNIHTVAVDYPIENTYGARSKYCSEQLIAPHYKQDTEAFICFLEDYASKQAVPPVLIPCHDSYVEVVDEHLERLRQMLSYPPDRAWLIYEADEQGNLASLSRGHGCGSAGNGTRRAKHHFWKRWTD